MAHKHAGAAATDMEEMIQDVAMGVHAMSIPGSSSSQSARHTLVTPNRLGVRPLDEIARHGPPVNPIPFGNPRFERGRRDDVLVYIEKSGSHQVAHNVLFRDFSREFGDRDGGLSRVKQAYWPLPYKEKINTIMGHVEICVVLTRCIRDSSDDDLSSSGSDHSDGDEDIVFSVAKRYVAVKVNYGDRMERLRNRHAEDPLKEIAAMQVIGNSHPNVMGTIEVLYDGSGSNLNVVMPYCGSGDLFELLQGSQSLGRGFTEGVARYWFRQLIEGMNHLHSRGICHRDLSPENVMIDHDNSLIIDMGMAIQVPYTDPSDPTQVTDIARGTTKRMILPQGGKVMRCQEFYVCPIVFRV
jgi:tRNA A-37 threonylcarbamoyl transferase component Bud32